MLALPASEHKQVFYSFVISELCRQDTKSIPPILGKLIFTIYEHLQDLDVELQCRFSTWFSHHLSNFNYQWNWKEWAHVLESPRHHPAALFVRESMEKCVRLSYWERVGKQLPAGFEVMMPCQPEPTFKYQTGTPFAVDADSISFAQRLLESMRLKQSFEEIQPLVDEIVAYGASKGMTGFDPNEEKGVSLARDIIVQCVLFMGCKSFSHVLNAIER
jgi:nuclear cap-binding protein subunit 1